MTEPRAARPTVKFIDEYCDSYKSLFPEVRSFEAFKQLHVGLVSDIKRKTLPHIAQVGGIRAGVCGSYPLQSWSLDADPSKDTVQ